jgi:DNA-binding NtrC family response regulator
MSDVLILDDDVLLRELMADTLRNEGLEVLTVGDTDTAMAMLQEPGARVLVADKRLDGAMSEDGHVLADTATRLYPTLRVVYISGEPGAQMGHKLTFRERALPKPFAPNELVDRI